MDILNSELKKNPDLESLNLEFKAINNLQPLLPLLAKFPNLRELSLHGNRLGTIPDNLSVLKNLESLDISNNLISDVSSVVKGLSTLPKLKKLSLNLRGKEDEEYLASALQNLEYLNDTALKNQSNQQSFDEGTNPNDTVSDIALKQDDLEAVAVLYDCIRELYKEHDENNDKILAEQFDSHVRNVMSDLGQKLTVKVDPKILNCHVLKAKYALYEICFSKIIEFIGNIDPRLSSVLEGIHDAHALLFKNLNNYLENSNHSEKKEDSEQNIQLLEAAELLEKESQKLKSEKEQIIQNYEEEKKELLEHIKSLEEENQKYLDTIIKHSKENAANFTKIITPKLDRTQENYQNKSSNTIIMDTSSNIWINDKNISHRSNAMNVGVNAPIGTTSLRALTIKQLKDVIEEIYISKTKYDQKCLDLKLPRETMEQHMYTYLNQKYGLKNLIIEWATAIINGIKKFSGDDNDIATFGKILRNECDEEFRFVQTQVKATISELLKMYLRGKFPLKHNTEIKNMIESKLNGYIFEEECNDIIRYMYNQDDSEFLLDKIKKYFTSPSKALVDIKKLNREEQVRLMNEKEKSIIEYNIFQKIILDFQLRSHERFLKNFVNDFRLVDKDNNGIIDEGEFHELCTYLEKHKIQYDITKFLLVVDPYNHQQITFSQCVSLFSNENVTVNGEALSILQKISIDS